MPRFRKVLTAGAVALTLLIASGTAAQAAAPKLPGRILFLNFPGSVRDTFGLLRSVHPDGSSPLYLPQTMPIWGFPDYSPDGSRIAYCDDYSFDSAAADGSDVQTLAEASYEPSNPRWSPDGRWIVGESGGDIWRVSANGSTDGGFTDLTGDYIFNDLSVSWAPGSKRFATATYPGIQIYTADGSRTRTLTDLDGAWHVAWNPKGDILAVQALDDIWLVDVGTGAVTRVTDTPDMLEFSPIWSPDGKWLAYAHGPGTYVPDQLEDVTNPTIWVMNRNGGNQHSTGIRGVPTSWRDIP